jgi:hypothetical protein
VYRAVCARAFAPCHFPARVNKPMQRQPYDIAIELDLSFSKGYRMSR